MILTEKQLWPLRSALIKNRSHLNFLVYCMRKIWFSVLSVCGLAKAIPRSGFAAQQESDSHAAGQICGSGKRVFGQAKRVWFRKSEPMSGGRIRKSEPAADQEQWAHVRCATDQEKWAHVRCVTDQEKWAHVRCATDQEKWAHVRCATDQEKWASSGSGTVSPCQVCDKSGKVSPCQVCYGSEKMSQQRIRKSEPWCLDSAHCCTCCHFFCRALMRTGNSCVVFAQETGNISSHIRCTHPPPLHLGYFLCRCVHRTLHARAFAISIEG